MIIINVENNLLINILCGNGDALFFSEFFDKYKV